MTAPTYNGLGSLNKEFYELYRTGRLKEASESGQRLQNMLQTLFKASHEDTLKLENDIKEHMEDYMNFMEENLQQDIQIPEEEKTEETKAKKGTRKKDRKQEDKQVKRTGRSIKDLQSVMVTCQQQIKNIEKGYARIFNIVAIAADQEYNEHMKRLESFAPEKAWQDTIMQPKEWKVVSSNMNEWRRKNPQAILTIDDINLLKAVHRKLHDKKEKGFQMRGFFKAWVKREVQERKREEALALLKSIKESIGKLKEYLDRLDKLATRNDYEIHEILINLPKEGTDHQLRQFWLHVGKVLELEEKNYVLEILKAEYPLTQKDEEIKAELVQTTKNMVTIMTSIDQKNKTLQDHLFDENNDKSLIFYTMYLSKHALNEHWLSEDARKTLLINIKPVIEARIKGLEATFMGMLKDLKTIQEGWEMTLKRRLREHRALTERESALLDSWERSMGKKIMSKEKQKTYKEFVNLLIRLRRAVIHAKILPPSAGAGRLRRARKEIAAPARKMLALYDKKKKLFSPETEPLPFLKLLLPTLDWENRNIKEEQVQLLRIGQDTEEKMMMTYTRTLYSRLKHHENIIKEMEAIL